MSNGQRRRILLLRRSHLSATVACGHLHGKTTTTMATPDDDGIRKSSDRWQVNRRNLASVIGSVKRRTPWRRLPPAVANSAGRRRLGGCRRVQTKYRTAAAAQVARMRLPPFYMVKLLVPRASLCSGAARAATPNKIQSPGDEPRVRRYVTCNTFYDHSKSIITEQRSDFLVRQLMCGRPTHLWYCRGGK